MELQSLISPPLREKPQTHDAIQQLQWNELPQEWPSKGLVPSRASISLFRDSPPESRLPLRKRIPQCRGVSALCGMAPGPGRAPLQPAPDSPHAVPSQKETRPDRPASPSTSSSRLSRSHRSPAQLVLPAVCDASTSAAGLMPREERCVKSTCAEKITHENAPLREKP